MYRGKLPCIESDTVLVTHQIQELFRRAAALAADVTEASGLHPTDARALRVLDAVGSQPLTVGELGGRLGLASASVTALVDRLEAAGLVRRDTDAKDRRRVLVVLSDSARRLGQRQLAPLGVALRRATDASDEAQLASVKRFLGVLLDER